MKAEMKTRGFLRGTMEGPGIVSLRCGLFLMALFFLIVRSTAFAQVPAQAVNNSTSTRCAEEDNVTIPLFGMVMFFISKRHSRSALLEWIPAQRTHQLRSADGSVIPCCESRHIQAL